MRSSKMLMLTGAIIVVLTSFLIAREDQIHWGTSTPSFDATQEPAIDAASLPYLGAGQTLAFADGQNQSSLLSGWSSPEPGGVWSEGNAAYVGFVVNGAVVPKEAIVQAGVFLVPGKLDKQHVQVWWGGKKLAEYDLKDEDAQFPIPLDDLTIKNGSPVILGFYLPDARAPQQLDVNGDARLIALSIQSLRLATSNDPTQSESLTDTSGPASPSFDATQEPAIDAASLPYLGAGQTLAFADGQNQSSLLSGWSSPEPGGVWSEGNAAYVGFVVNGAVVPKEAIVQAGVFLVPGKLDKQHVQVWSGGKKLAEYDLKDEDAQFPIPLDDLTIKNGSPVILGFYLPDARAPQQLDVNGDARLIALSIQSLRLATSNDPTQSESLTDTSGPAK